MENRMEKLKKKAEKQGLNISDDALFVASELRDTIKDARNLVFMVMLPVMVSGFGALIGIGAAILASL